MRRLRPLSEAECYARCYGGGDENVRVVRLQPPRRREPARLSGEELRRLFEERLDGREPEIEAA
jgi:hypothetical protein